MKSPLLSAALTQALRAAQPKRLNGTTNMIGEVLSYGDASIKVKALNGPLEGQEMEIFLPKNGKAKITDFTRPSKAQTSMYTEPGGVLRFDRVEKKKDGEGYTCNWINTFIKVPSDDNKIISQVQTSIVETGTTTTSGYPHVRLNTIDGAQERKVGSLDELQEALADAFTSHRGALIVDVDGANYGTSHAALGGAKKDGEYIHNDPAAQAAKVIADLPAEVREIFIETLASRGLTIVPMASLPIGGKTAEEIGKKMKEAEEAGKVARIMSINPLAYQPSSIGQRLDNALNRKDREGNLVIAKEHADRLAAAFLDGAAEDAKAAFHKDGWKSVADVDIKTFFAAKGVELRDHPADSWNVAAVHQQRFEGGTDFFAAKTHELNRYGNPYPNLECTKELRAAYGNELVEAVQAYMAAPKVEKAAEATVAAQPEAAAVAEEAAGATQEVDTADLDDMLADVLNGQ